MRSALAVAAVLLVSGCGVSTDEQPRALDPAQAPFRVLDEPAPAPEGDGRVALYFVRDDQVVLQPRPVERSTGIPELLDLLLDGPTREQVAAGTRTALPTTLTVEDVTVGPTGVAVVSLGGAVDAPVLGFAQIVATLTAPGRARAVRFRSNGTDLEVPRGDGLLTSQPLDRDDYRNLINLPSPGPTASPSPSA